ncbi:MAG: biotin--[acetyl-CoA-carboxylase] ligase [Desulfuromonadaceae bacterium]|nr:biotin--[acetyl-CoA-carboxylase] ligase [Desulfuromonadaceae bacterium]
MNSAVSKDEGRHAAEPGLRERILELFFQADGGVLSGEDLSQKLGVTRAAVWKHMRHLRDAGYGIEAVPSRGYRLCSWPDLLLPAAIRGGLLPGQVVGRQVDYHEQLGSTNQQAQMLAEQGAVEGTVVVAEEQSSGRGRLGRHWVSPSGVNLYTSVVLRPRLSLLEVPQLTFLVAVAVARALEQVAQVRVTVKWPNDILLGGHKIAGLLNELSAETEGVHYVVLGIGVNLNMRAEQFPSDLRYPATSVLLATGRPVSRIAFAQQLYAQLDQLYHLMLEKGFTPIRLAWESLFDLVGRTVQVDLGRELVAGTVLGIAGDGALLLQVGSEVKTIYAGDVRPC